MLCPSFFNKQYTLFKHRYRPIQDYNKYRIYRHRDILAKSGQLIMFIVVSSFLTFKVMSALGTIATPKCTHTSVNNHSYI